MISRNLVWVGRAVCRADRVPSRFVRLERDRRGSLLASLVGVYGQLDRIHAAVMVSPALVGSRYRSYHQPTESSYKSLLCRFAAKAAIDRSCARLEGATGALLCTCESLASGLALRPALRALIHVGDSEALVQQPQILTVFGL